MSEGKYIFKSVDESCLSDAVRLAVDEYYAEQKNVSALYDKDYSPEIKSSIAELFYGSARSSAPEKNNALIDEFLLLVDIVQSDLPVLRRFGQLRSELRDQGFLLPDADILIAATTYEKARLLVTGNIKHFQRFPDLSVENWIQ